MNYHFFQSCFVVLLFQVNFINSELNANFRYFRLTYYFLAVLLCSVLYWRCILTLQNSRTNRRTKLLTLVFTVNMISWVVTVVPHLIYMDFFLKGEQTPLVFYFLRKMVERYMYLTFGDTYDHQIVGKCCFYTLKFLLLL